MERERSLLHFLENWKKVLLFWGKKALILVIYRLNFSLKMQFLSFSWRKSPKFLRVWSFVFVFLMNIKENNRFIDSLLENFQKIMKMLNFPIFNFIILNSVKKGILDPSCYYSLRHIYEICHCRALWMKILEAMKALILTITIIN